MKQQVDDEDHSVKHSRSVSPYLLRRLIIGGLALLLIAAIVVGIVMMLFAGQQRQQIVQTSEVVTYSTDTPSEDRPDDTYRWRGASGDPMKLTISGIGVDAYIQNVGVDQNQQIAVPNNVHIAGWFIDSVKPGDKGLSIIDGHLDGVRGEGVFDNLESVAIGEVFTVEFGSGEKRDFRVKEVKTVGLNEAIDVLYSQDMSISKQLNLITCGGVYDTAKNEYDKRVIVISERVE